MDTGDESREDGVSQQQDGERQGMDEASPLRLIAVFALGCGAGMRFRGPLARQVTDDIAGALSRFGTLVAQPQHLIAVGDPEQVDPTLEEGVELDQVGGGDSPRLKFILFSTLPSDSMVRSLSRSAGARLALSGRLVIEGDSVDLALNLWDVGPPNLLWCRLLYGDLETLPELVADAVGHLAHRLEDPAAEDLDAAIATAQRSIGTRSQRALWAYASVTEKLRRAALDPRASVNVREVTAGLVSTLQLDPAYEAPRLLLFEQALDRLRARDVDYAATLVTELGRLGEDRLVYGLLKLEALLLLGRRDEAQAVVRALEARWPADARVAAARGRLSA